MSGSIELAAPLGEQEWDDAVLAAPTSTPFHHWAFLDAAARDWGLAFEPLIARHDGVVVGGVAQLVDRRYGLRWANHLPLINYLGPAVPPDHLASTLAAMASRERRRTMRERQEVRLDPALAPDVAGWRRRTGTTMVVPLHGRSLEDLGRQASRGFRHAPSLAERRELTIGPSTEQDLREVLPRLERQIFGKQDERPPYRDDTYWTVWQAFARRGLAHAATAYIDGVPVGVTVALVHGDVAYEWVSATDHAYRAARPSMAVRRHLILWAHAAGHREYDTLGGSTPGITDFKRSLGATEKPYVIYERGRRL